MALKIGDNFSYNGKKPLDSRNQFSTIAQMTAFAETSLDEGHISYVKETNKYYTFNSANEADVTLGKWRELNTGGVTADEKVKLNAESESAKYLNELVDSTTIEVDESGGVIKVISLDGLETTVATLNFVKSLDKDIMLYLSSISNPMTFKGVVADDAALVTITDMQSGDTYIVQYSASNAGKTMTFIYNGTDFVPMAETTITVRDFTIEPIDLTTETTGTLSKAKIDAAIARLADVLDKSTYKGSADGIVKQADKLTGLTATIANLNAAVANSHTHANKSILDKIVANGIGDGFLADNGKYISFLHIGTTSPTYDSQLWVDNTDTATPVLKIFDGISWIEVSGSSGGSGSSVVVDSAISDTSTNPVQNKVIKEYVDSKTVEISKASDNAIQNKTDGIYVKDLSATVDNIYIAQSIVNKPSSTNLLQSDVYEFNLTAATTAGTGATTVLSHKHSLKQSIMDFEYLELSLQPVTGQRGRIPKITRIRTDSIVFNNSTTAQKTDGSMFNFSLDVETNNAGSEGIFTIIVTGWFMNETEVYFSEAITPIASPYWSGAYHVYLYGVNSSPVIDPLEYVNEESGIEDTPVGHIIAHMGTTAPKHYLICDGTEYNIADYPNLAEHFKTDFGSFNYFGGDGTTTFAVPDLRGEFLRGTGVNSRTGQGSGAGVGEHQDGTVHTNIDAHYETNANYLSISRNLPDISADLNTDKTINGVGLGRSWVKLSSSNENENNLIGNYTSRPTNTSVLYCIKYEPTYYMQNTYNGNVYSTEEQIVGKWIDGKPLYQKSFQFGAVKGEKITTLGKIDDMDLGFVDSSASYYINTNINFAAVNSTFMLNASGRGVDKATYTSYVVVQNDGNIVWYTGADVATSGGICTVKYTKTTS